MAPEQHPISCDVAIKDGQIAAIDTKSAGLDSQATERIDAKGALLMPGWVNVRTTMTAMSPGTTRSIRPSPRRYHSRYRQLWRGLCTGASGR